MYRLLTLIFILPLTLLGQPTDDELFQAFHWRNIGPANQGGRIVDIEALESDFAKVWIATGSGGVWHSENAGTTWRPIFDDYETASIGDIAINQSNPQIIWIGTGEANNRNSVSWGHGMYRSTDGGQSFQHLGLEETHQIARVILHPVDPDQAYVAAIGHLWGYSGDRGLFHTEDGGKNWSKLTKGLPADGQTGCTDLVMDPSNPKVLYAAFYQRLRQPWHFESGGPNGGIFKSTNGGRTWTQLTHGLPASPTGRIGLAIYQQNPRIIMALVEANQSSSLDTLGSGLYRSEDAGTSWKYVNTFNNRPFYYSQIRINPYDDQKVYLLTTRFMVSTDGGKTLSNGSEDQEVHGDFHAMWLDPSHPDRYYLGADKGLSLTHDHGKHFQLIDNISIAQFYRINYDMRDPYVIYGGLQDNGMYGIASFARDARGILNDHNWKLHWGDGQFIDPHPEDWREVFTSTENGSVSLYNAETYEMANISPAPHTIVNYEEMIADSLQHSGREFRFNWTSPMMRSPHDPHALYLAGNHIFQSVDRGKSWTIISPDLTTNHVLKRRKGVSGGITPDNSGAETHCAISTLSLSPIDPRLIWAGTDDGLVQVTQDGGQSWQNVRSLIPDVPENTWVSRIEASHHDPRVAYVTFDGHRNDDNRPWIFRADQYGTNWTKLNHNLPDDEVLRVVREDPVNANLLFLGSETGVWASLNAGASWSRLMPSLPTVSVYDLKIHSRENDLIAGTHGRGVWIMDNISPLQQLDAPALSSNAWLFAQKPLTLWENTSRGGQRGHFWFAGENPPTINNTSSLPRAEFSHQAVIYYLVNHPFDDPPIIEISDPHQSLVAIDTLINQPGIHRFVWNLEFDADWLDDDLAKEVKDTFERLLKQYRFSSLRSAAERFETAKTPREQRSAAAYLTTTPLIAPLDSSLGVPKAGPGVYIIKMQAGDQEYLRRLVIREDPIKHRR